MNKKIMIPLLMAIINGCEITLLVVFNKNGYANVPMMGSYIILNVMMIGVEVFFVFRYLMNKNETYPALFTYGGITLAVCILLSPIFYIINLPSYTFQNAQHVIKVQTNTHISKAYEKKVAGDQHDDYYIKGTSSGETVYYIFNPYTGDYHKG